MNTKQRIAASAFAAAFAAALAMLGAAAAHAEAYDGVHAITSSASRADVNAEAVAATREGNTYSDTAAEGAVPFKSTLARSAVREQAVAAANNPLQSLDRRAFYRDEVPAAYKKPSVSFTQQAGLPSTARP
ncbi:alpha/beta hydrolase [Variovorax sp. W6]|uniref:alpha/beta hydrolase n=1 Tax=Variovorax sp. W6 TaxID=3093895 RepID=UPI003D808153